MNVLTRITADSRVPVGRRPHPSTGLLEPAKSGLGRQRLIVGVTVLAVAYNALLAFFAAQGGPATFGTAAALEIGIIILTLGLAVSAGVRGSDAAPLSYLFVTVLIALFISMANETFFVDAVRNVLIIAAFTMLGARATERTVRLAFTICLALALAFLILEVVSLPTYAAIFKPGEYLEKTRGYVQKEFYEETGLSLGTIAYRGRFSFGLFDGPRTSTIFLEQVGINCFAIVVMVYLATMWNRLARWEKALAIITIVMILVTNNARMASLLTVVFIAGYFVFPRLPRYGNIAIPIFLVLSVFALFEFETPKRSDDLIGRLGVTYSFLTKLSVQDLLLGNAGLSRRAYDTGYGYIIVTATIFGGIAYWAYLTVVVPHRSILQRRCAWAVAAYIYLWLLVGGTGSFSMKTASLLWLLVGFVRVQDASDAAAAPAGRSDAPLARPIGSRILTTPG